MAPAGDKPTNIQTSEAVRLMSAKSWVKQTYATLDANMAKTLLDDLKVNTENPGQQMNLSNFETVSLECKKVLYALDHLNKQVNTAQEQYNGLISAPNPNPRSMKPTQELTYLNLLAKNLLTRIDERQRTFANDITGPLEETHRTDLPGMFGSRGAFGIHRNYLNEHLTTEAVRLYITGKSVIEYMRAQKMLPNEFEEFVWEPEKRPRPSPSSTSQHSPSLNTHTVELSAPRVPRGILAVVPNRPIIRKRRSLSPPAHPEPKRPVPPAPVSLPAWLSPSRCQDEGAENVQFNGSPMSLAAIGAVWLGRLQAANDYFRGVVAPLDNSESRGKFQALAIKSDVLVRAAQSIVDNTKDINNKKSNSPALEKILSMAQRDRFAAACKTYDDLKKGCEELKTACSAIQMPTRGLNFASHLPAHGAMPR